MKMFEIAQRTKDLQKAGFIPYIIEDGVPLMMFMVPSDPEFGGSKPAIAKGLIDPGEDEKTAALREAAEELGLRESNIKSNTISQAWRGMISGLRENYMMTIFVGEVKNKQDFDAPHFETGEVHWLTYEQFKHQGRASQQHIVLAAETLINSL